MSNIAIDYKIAKNALSDLLTMARAATKRLSFAIKSLVQKKEEKAAKAVVEAVAKKKPGSTPTS